MPPEFFSSKIHWRYRRFLRLFRREKRSLIDLNYSYQYMMRFPRLPITVPPLVPTLMTYRWTDNDDDYDLSPKKHLRNNDNQQQQQQHIRRRFSKRFSDIVGPTSTKLNPPQNDSSIQKKQSNIPSSYKYHRTSFKRNPNEGIYVINSYNKKSSEHHSSTCRTKKSDASRRYNSKTKHSSTTTNSVDILAHRMQAAMSSELMYSLDRNFVFGDKKHLLNSTYINRSHSFQVSIPSSTDDWWDKRNSYHHMIPRVKECLDEENKSISLDEPTPDYEEEEDEEIILKKVHHNEISDEPTIDYDDLKSTGISETDETSPSHYDLGVSLSCNAPQTSITPSSEIGTQEQSITIPPTPPPLPEPIIDQRKATFRCRTIADKITPNHKLILKDDIEIPNDKKSQINPTIPPKPCHLYISKELLEKTILRKVSHPVSRAYSTYGSMSQLNDHRTESTTLCQKSSIIDEQQSSDGLSSSATTSIVIENEYEHRASSKIYNDYKRRASVINVPINSTYSQSAIIHPMHTHIGLRSSTSSTSANDKPNDIILSNKQMNLCVINQLNQHLSTRFSQQQQQLCLKKTQIEDKTNVYDEPQHIEITKSISTKSLDIISSSIPPPPPPLPVGGFRPVISTINSQRTSIMTLPRETNNNSDLGGSPGTSTTSSKLSDTRILRELRTNPLFTKAKQHLEIDNNKCNSMIETKNQRIKSNDSNQHSELELMFQKRAQRND